MNWIKELFSKKKNNQCAISVVVSSVTTDKCLCKLNTEGQNITGWCREHHTDWL